MAEVLIASDAQWVVDEVTAALSSVDDTVRTVTSGAEVLPAVAEQAPDVAVIDLQIGRMGGMATCLDLRLEEGAGRLPHVPVLMLLDRRPDVFLARRAKAEGWLVKPLDALRVRKAITAVIGGGTYEDDSYRPVTVVPAAAPTPGQ
ncbi:MAG: response regulator transcription factor [Acidimicrobiia bacterium]|nr:response regulator transcription factor [Acidimicrobiia bacterium]MBV8297338.1 response regulator transcription factor [Acidimicrobiia bacterium]MBV8305082.1 response regulator transcription factor [Acidimicrobiia bacterium]